MPVDEVAPTSDQILQMLVAVGGSRYVDALGPKPVQWTTRLEGVGAIAIAAVMREDKVQARFVVARREAGDPPSSRPQVLAEAQKPARPAPIPVVAPAPQVALPPRRPLVDDEPTVQRVVPAVSRPTPSVAELDDLDLVDRDEGVEAPTRPGTAGMSLELDLERAVAAAVVMPPPPPPPRVLESEPPTAPATVRRPMGLDGYLETGRSVRASDIHLVAGRPLARARRRASSCPAARTLSDVAVETIGPPARPRACRATLEARRLVRLRPRPAGCSGASASTSPASAPGSRRCFRLHPAPRSPRSRRSGCPPQIERATHHHQGLIVRHRARPGHGKTTHAGGHRRHHQHRDDPPRHHGRGPDRVRPPAQEGDDEPARGGHAHPLLRSALKASLREDPDVIVVGELRDTETVRMALAASETGHLVLGTMNTPSAAKTIDRADRSLPARRSAAGAHDARGRPAPHRQPAPPPRHANGKGMVAAAELLPGHRRPLEPHPRQQDLPDPQPPAAGQGHRHHPPRRVARATWCARGGRRREAALAVAENPDDLEQSSRASAADRAAGAAAAERQPPHQPRSPRRRGPARQGRSASSASEGRADGAAIDALFDALLGRRAATCTSASATRRSCAPRGELVRDARRGRRRRRRWRRSSSRS